MSRIPFPLLSISIAGVALASQACSAFNPLIDQRAHQICSTSPSVAAEEVDYRRERIYKECTQVIDRRLKMSDLYRAKLKRLHDDPTLVSKYQAFLANEAQKVQHAKAKIAQVSKKDNTCTEEELRWMGNSHPNSDECRLRRIVEKENAQRSLQEQEILYTGLTDDGFEGWLDENGYLKKLPMQDYIE